jgi:hypothetical protein
MVALKVDRKTVVGSGGTVEKALQGAQKKGYANSVITKMPKDIMSVACF